MAYNNIFQYGLGYYGAGDSERNCSSFPKMMYAGTPRFSLAPMNQTQRVQWVVAKNAPNLMAGISSKKLDEKPLTPNQFGVM